MLSKRTIEEMKAGAQALAQSREGADLTPEKLARILTIHERRMVLREWEKRGWITINKNHRLDHKTGIRTRWTNYHVIGMPQPFTDEGAEELGASPSELLIAQMALALASQGRTL